MRMSTLAGRMRIDFARVMRKCSRAGLTTFLILSLAITPGANGQDSIENESPISLRFESPQLEAFSGVSILIYEAVRSGRFDRIEVTFHRVSISDLDNNLVQKTSYVLRTVDNFEVCASTALPEHGHIGSFRVTPDTQPILFQPKRFDHQLVAGHCVIAYPADELGANHVVTAESQWSLSVEETPSATPLISDGEKDDIWQLTGNARPPQFDLWNLEGSKKRQDDVSDIALIRAIKAGGEMQRAALSLIEGRLKTRFQKSPDGRPERYIERTPPTPETVVREIFESEILLKTDDQRRALALRALFAAGNTDQSAAVMSQVVEMLGRRSTKRLESAERAFHRSTNSMLKDEFFDTSEGEPLYKNVGFFQLASQLALLYGGDAAAKLANSYQDWLRSQLLNQLMVDTDIVRVATYGDGRTELVDALINKANQKGGAPGPIQARAELLISSGPQRSAKLQALVDSSCEGPGGMFPHGDRDRAKEFCLEVMSTH